MGAKIKNDSIGQERLRHNLKVKYLLDKILAYPVFFLAMPFFLLTAWIIKLDGWLNPKNAGSIFYLEPRISAGKPFKVFKFRTVTKKDVDWIRKEPQERSITWHTTRTDAGKIIIKWYFDEVPQLINILKGDMSFVGPRPHIKGVYDKEVEEGLFYRTIMRAGLFGIPQSCKRNPKHKALFERLARQNKAEKSVLNTLDGVYARECIYSSTWRVVALDFIILAYFFLVFLKGSPVQTDGAKPLSASDNKA
tara:strand:+ start:36 stop:785 length:750 start_codon:yes stop_codon:yes gene_type:complete